MLSIIANVLAKIERTFETFAIFLLKYAFKSQELHFGGTFETIFR